MDFEKTTEKDSKYNHLEKMSITEIITHINNEDKTVPLAVENAIPQIRNLIEQVTITLKNGGRLFYIGAGTSGRLGILDASECPPTFGVSHDLVIGLIAGGDSAIRNAVEFAEDSIEQCWKDLKKHTISKKDLVIGIAASGTTPYVLNGLKKCNDHQIKTGCIVCNKNSPISLTAIYPIEVVVGPEFLTGSSRMKAGTAQKIVLNMITTTTMIQLGRVKGNKMFDMELSNYKLINRATKMIMKELDISKKKAERLLDKYGNVRNVLKQNTNGQNQ